MGGALAGKLQAAAESDNLNIGIYVLTIGSDRKREICDGRHEVWFPVRRTSIQLYLGPINMVMLFNSSPNTRKSKDSLNRRGFQQD